MFLLAAFAQSSAQAKPLSELEQTLITNTKAIPEAQKTKDVAVLKRMLTDDFVAVGSEVTFTIRKRCWAAHMTAN